MDLLVPCIVEGRSELRNVGRVNCKTHWPFSGCGTPYSLNVYIALQIKLRVLTSPAARSVESALFLYTHSLCVYTNFKNFLRGNFLIKIFSREQRNAYLFKPVHTKGHYFLIANSRSHSKIFYCVKIFFLARQRFIVYYAIKYFFLRGKNFNFTTFIFFTAHQLERGYALNLNISVSAAQQ